ncbi:ADP-ribosylglycohydrolase family protein [Rathayibacter sp. AY1A7]|uniref:ADP-ribosylglycohydrolase family protein n=1 Tax=Rathayibacter sp. AY1A7 TaxID=2080524 RepID=UPI0011B097E1|nr:ADP-ribosylglycohydrolase family protein [Rathayibacter sp. AY1A7]
MLWAAWADALGFISELTSAENLRRRTRGRELTRPMPWSRIVGGRMGVRVELPEGCYSDDTQLRLATSRAISNHGFDVEAFARVEMPVWPSYALGGGRASKAAAAAMAKQQANWANNFFDGWENAGGNGAAMRIQPHVYAAPELRSLRHLDDVICNTIVTHGHPRGIIGAVFHAVALTFTLDRGAVPGPDSFGTLLQATRDALGAFERQPELAGYWLPQWERKTERSFALCWHETIDEVEEILRTAAPAWRILHAAGQNRDEAIRGYGELVRLLRLEDETVRGSGTLTSAAALLLASAFPDHPAQSAQIAASRLHTDTDTIGTMAAAIVGAASPKDLLSPVLDEDYLRSEADRLYAISQGRAADTFPYPDLLNWQPPKSAVDATGIDDGNLALAGISYLSVTGQATTNKDGAWVWARTWFGQSVLVKLRRELRQLPTGNRPLERRPQPTEAIPYEEPTPPKSAPRQLELTEQPLFDDADLRASGVALDDLLAQLARDGYPDLGLGKAIRLLAENGNEDDLRRFTAEIAPRLKRR